MFMSLCKKKKNAIDFLYNYMNWLFSFSLYYSPKYPYYYKIIPLRRYFMSIIPEKMLA